MPAMPQITADLAIAPQIVQGTITFYLATFGAAHLIWGPMGDQILRKTPLYAALEIFALGLVLAKFAPTAPMLIAAHMRLRLRLGAAIQIFIPHAIVRDISHGAGALFAPVTATLFALTLSNAAPLAVLIGLLALGNAGLGQIIPTSIGMTLENQGKHAGVPRSNGGRFQMLLCRAITTLAGGILSDQPAPLAGLIAAAATVTFDLAWAAKRA